MEELNPDGANKKICLRGAEIDRIRDAVLEINNDFDVKRLAIHGGSNSIPFNTPLQVAYDIINFLSEVKLLMPRTEVFFSAILPKSSSAFSYDNSYLPGINEINTLVYSACNTLGVKFIQHSRFSRDGIVNEALFTLSDYVHLNRRGVRQFSYDLKTSLA